MSEASGANEAADRREIDDLLIRYCTLVDRKDVDTLVSQVFAEDAVDNHGLGIWSGREGLHQGFTWVLSRFAGTVHQITNVDVRLEVDRASSRAYVTGWHWLPRAGEKRRPAGPAADFVVVGSYDDELERRPAGWRIVHRTFRQVGYSVLGTGTLPDFMVPQRPDL
ncbi:MAG TPA: nuclear transport factor 2 family protein [Solirubrobacterales bacterium]|nr:nuclear transport factor 2 family protein [Solirubrobacterales bacterium]